MNYRFSFFKYSRPVLTKYNAYIAAHNLIICVSDSGNLKTAQLIDQFSNDWILYLALFVWGVYVLVWIEIKTKTITEKKE